MQEPAERFTHIMTNTIPSNKGDIKVDTPVVHGQSFTILSFQPRKSGEAKASEPAFLPYSIKRHADSEVFTIGDFVTNGTKMRGYITAFSMLDEHIFVEHTWSGVGMYLENLSKILVLPSEHQIDDAVWYTLWSGNFSGEIRGVHFYGTKVKYDLELFGSDGETTRIYNIDSKYVKKTISK